MRVLLVVHRFLPHLAGTEIYTYHLARELSVGHDVKIYCRDSNDTTPGFSATERTIEGLPLRRVSLNLRGLQRNRYRMFVSSYENPEIERDFAQALRHFRPDVVHFQHMMYLSARLPAIARQHRIPAVITLHDYWFKCNNGILVRRTGDVCHDKERFFACADCAGRGRRSLPIRSLMAVILWRRDAMLRRALLNAEAIVAPSQFLRDQFVNDGYVSADKIRVIENGIDTANVVPHRPRADGEPMRFVYIGSIAPHKGVHVLVEAFNNLTGDSSVQLDIWGNLDAEPEYVETLRRTINRPDIRLRGSLERQHLWRVLGESDVLVVPSLWYEANSPLVIREALAAGVPVVASQLGAVAEKIDPGRTGLVFPPGDTGALADVLQHLADTPAIIEEMRRCIRPPVSIAEHVNQIEDLYRAVCATGSPSRRFVASWN